MIGYRTRTLGDDFGALMQSRGVRALLIATSVLQTVAVLGKHQGTEAQPEPVQPMRAQPAVVAAKPAPAPKPVAVAAKPKPAVAPKAEKPKVHPSQELASKYRKQGYKISSSLARDIYEVAVESEIDPAVAFGLVRAESGFRTGARSPVGAVGLTQLMPATARWMEPGVTRSALRDSETNLRVGFKYLRYLVDKYDGDTKLALLAYNRGPGTVDRALKRGRNPDNGYADFVYGKKNHGHKLYTSK